MDFQKQYLWWQTGVIYQIYPRSFKDTSGNGIGDLAGIIEKMDYLTDTLGVDAIWISPFYPSPMKDFGYDVADYVDVDPLFGDLKTFDELIMKAHQRYLRVIIDLVINHTSDQHSWFLESRSSKKNPKRDWYVWVDPESDGSPPNNWLSVFGGSAWEWDDKTGQYYLHSFLKEQPDLNYRNPQVWNAMASVIRFWLDRGVDGYRIDVAHYIMKDPQLQDNPLVVSPRQRGHRPLYEYDTQIHLYDKGHEDLHPIYRKFRKLIDAYNHDWPRVSVGEVHIFELEEWVKYYGENLDEIHMPFNFKLLYSKWDARTVRAVVDELEAILPVGAWPNYVLGNHDESRLASRIGKSQTRVAAMLLLTLRGTPTLYMGDEIGMTDVKIPLDRIQDPPGLIHPIFSRDPCRTPMQWDDFVNAGFSGVDTRSLWLPLAGDFQAINVKQALSRSDSLLNLYRQLLEFRRKTPALQW
ncbi:MAG: alpha-amylase, partial [Anaerolineales bacterium]|nr:alpha-amylase [Anaerolineales bacterium]